MTPLRHTRQCIQVPQTHSRRKGSTGPVNSHRSQEGVWTIAGSMAKTSFKFIKTALAPSLSIQATRSHIGSPTMSLHLKSQVWSWLQCMILSRSFRWLFSLLASTPSNQHIPALQALPRTLHMGLEARNPIGQLT